MGGSRGVYIYKASVMLLTDECLTSTMSHLILKLELSP